MVVKLHILLLSLHALSVAWSVLCFLRGLSGASVSIVFLTKKKYNSETFRNPFLFPAVDGLQD